MNDPFSWIRTELDRLDAGRLRRRRRQTTSLPEGKCLVEGQTLWNFAGNDYLGLADHPRVVQAAAKALRDSGAGSRASPLVTGRTRWHARLEARLARFKEAESSVLFPSGYAANVGTIGALAGPEDVLFCDRLNHASLIDGCRLSKARLRVYPHRDVGELAGELGRSTRFRRRLIVTDSLFSMDGDAAPLAELVRLAEDHRAMLLVDEAHATGLFGERGTGLIEELGVCSPAVISVGTLSKGLGTQGGFVTGSGELIEWLWNSARTQMFSTALSPALCSAAAEAIDVVEEEPQRRHWLAKASRQVHSELRRAGWTVPDDVAGPIIPILVGDAEAALTIASRLEELGVLAAAIRPPTVPAGTSRLRISLSYAHQDAGLQALLEALEICRD